MPFYRTESEPHLMLIPTKNRPAALARCLTSAIEMEKAYREAEANKHYITYCERPTVFYIADDSPTNSARAIVTKIVASAPD